MKETQRYKAMIEGGCQTYFCLQQQ